ncbi:MAG: hypothetical protein GY703_03515 [Gammaproteobacteria bacterium]|nr:hypothetical protein [Gammaproteobacteria bacterium]
MEHPSLSCSSRGFQQQTKRCFAVRIDAMKIPPPDLSWFAEILTDTVQVISDAYSDSVVSLEDDEASPALLQEALQQLIEVLQTQVRDFESEEYPADLAEQVDLSELGDYGLSMLLELYGIAAALDLEEQLETLEQLSLSLSIWVVEKEAELNRIDLVVNALARIANQNVDPGGLENLFYLMGEILDATPPLTPEDIAERPEPHPCQLLLLNRAIVATRVLSPQLMDIAFADVVELLPDQAPGFFQEGMEQVKIQNYPDPVREVIERFYHDCLSPKILH